MGYEERHAAAIEAIEHGVSDVPFGLTRRRRHVIVAVDRVGDHAVAWLMRRGGDGDPVEETPRFERRDGGWVSLGGGSSSGGDFFTPRPTRDEVAGFNAHGPSRSGGDMAMQLGGSWSRAATSKWPGRATDASSISLRCAAGCHTLTVADRSIDVGDHGYAIVLWTSRKPPAITGLDAGGQPLGSITPEYRPRPWAPPWHRVDWFRYSSQTPANRRRIHRLSRWARRR